VLGCIIYVFVALHSLLYLNYYIQVGELSHALFRLVPALGMATLFVMTVLYTTAWSIVRKYSYRVFYITHIIVALAAPPLVWFHVYHARLFMGESLLLFVVDLVVRKLRIIDSEAVIEIIPGTDLIKVIATVPSEKLRLFRAHPASYAYLSIPSASRPSQKQWSLASLRYTFTSNPFTVATVDEERSELTLVARQMRGPVTTALARLASMRSPDSKVALRVDGPYGATMHLPVLSGNRFDRVLLVAGGVGATFIMPLYEHVLAESASARVQMIWAVRDSDELRWPAPSGGKTIHDDDRIQLFVTGAPREDTSTDVDGSTLDGLDDDIELNRFELEGKTAAEARAENCRRPDLQVIVDEVFCQGAGERVAVLVCGPTNMARHVQKAVGKWVTQGRDVWFYNESYSW
jgi:NAD(P)H-flavin reductase